MKKFNVMVSILILLCLLINVTSIRVSAYELGNGYINNWGFQKNKVFECDLDNNCKVRYAIENVWGKQYEATIEIVNNSNIAYENWSLEFSCADEIQEIWNADIIHNDKDKYIIKNQNWNQDILPSSKITFGYIAEYKVEPGTITDIFMNECISLVDSQNYSIDWIIESQWEDGFTGAIILTNTGYNTIEDWILDYDYENEILELWNAIISQKQDNKYTLKNMGDNSIIASGESVYMGFTASGNPEIKPENIVLNEQNKIDINKDIDSDKDGLTDDIEKQIGTDINNADTDGDELTDYYEVYVLNTNPLSKDSDNNGIQDGDEDSDKDGLTNIEEFILGTNPLDVDTDEDNLSDYDEVNIYHTNPLLPDTDNDGINDGDEIMIGTNPNEECTYDNVKDIEYERECEIQKVEDFVNENYYSLQLTVKGTGCIENNLEIKEEIDNSELNKNNCMIGKPFTIEYNQGNINNIQLKCRVNDSVIQSDLGYEEELNGLNKFYLFKYDVDMDCLLPIETSIDATDNMLIANTDSAGTFCIIDMEKLIYMMDISEIENSMVDTLDESIIETQSLEDHIEKNILIYDKYNNHRYAIIEPKGKVTWENANLQCQLLGGHLVTINNSKEQEFIVKLLKKANRNSYWIGLKKNKDWDWVTKENISYFNWGANEPNNMNNQESYVSIYAKPTGVKIIGDWNDNQNDGASYVSEFYDIKNYGFICEWETFSNQFCYLSASGLVTKKLKAKLDRFGKTNSDTDLLVDSEEVNWKLMNSDGTLPTFKQLLEYKTGYVQCGLIRLPEKIRSKFLNYQVLPILSDPTSEDGDNDGYLDHLDKRPLINDVIIKEIKNKNYVPVNEKNGKASYGGSQMWFGLEPNINPDDIIHTSGCGKIAMSDLCLYWALYNSSKDNQETQLAIKNGKILEGDYLNYVRYMNAFYTPTDRIFGQIGVKLTSDINSYCKLNKYNYKAKWKNDLSNKSMLNKIEEMIDNDIPVILCIGPNSNNIFGKKKGIDFYTPVLKTDSKYNANLNQLYQYIVLNKEDKDIYGHYVTITGIIKDFNAPKENNMLQISSWGEKYYINYEEYRNYVQNLGDKWTSTIIYIKETN